MGNIEEGFAELLALPAGEWLASEPVTKAGQPFKGGLVPRRNGPLPGTGGRPKRQSLNSAATPALTRYERVKAHRSRKAQQRLENIAILDMETDPFDDTKEMKIRPFLAVLYSETFEHVIWEQDAETFVNAVVSAIEALPDRFTIYAHNGGRFDYLFLITRLRGSVAFKGRGIMSAKVGNHELRDSFHIIPERLASWQKDKFDYTKNLPENREANKAEIIRYCVNDCRYLLSIVRKFLAGFGLRLTIAQAAKYEMKKFYDVEKFTEGHDNYIRQWFFGGRVECLRGRGEFVGDYKLYDVNSLYPYVMASRSHPIGGFWSYQNRYGEPNENTVFLDLNCTNKGALVGRGLSPEGVEETTSGLREGRFRTTIWEYEVARKYKLIDNVKINFVVDCVHRSTLEKFVTPLYENRLHTKDRLAEMKGTILENGAEFMDIKKDDIFYKLIMNNGYGYQAINPRNFKENYLTDPEQEPPESWFKSLLGIEKQIERCRDDDEKSRLQLQLAGYRRPVFESDRYWIWQKPNPSFRFNNVGLAASITGAARSVLLEALQLATDPIYCDTDSIICRNLSGVPISKTALGAWDLEDTFSRVIVNGKKLYSVWHSEPKKRTAEQLADGLEHEYTVKSKGTSRITWPEMDCLLHGAQFKFRNRAPTLDRYGDQYYVKRTIRATAQFEDALQ